jgi:organic radical activating enzyme
VDGPLGSETKVAQNLQSLFIRATGLVTGNPTGEQFHLDDIDDPLTFFQERLDPRLSHYNHIACDVTDNCNLRCPFCINDFSSASAAKMHERHFARLIDIAPLGQDQAVFVSCLCEPLLHPRLLDLLKMIPPRLRNKFFLTTNLSVRPLPRSFFAELATTELHHVNVSIDSLQKDTFEQMRANAKYHVFMDNLAAISDVFSTTPGSPELRAITVAAQCNQAEIPSLIQTANDRYRVDFYELRYPFEEGTPMGSWREQNLLSDRAWRVLVDRVTAMPYLTHVSRGNSLLVCGFGQVDSAQADWGPPPVVEERPPVPWHLPLQLSLAPAWWRARQFLATRLPARLLAMPAMHISTATASGAGAVRLSGSPGHAAVGIAALNLGESGMVTVVPMIRGATGLMATVCATDPETGQCLATPAKSLTTEIAQHTTQTFTVFVVRRPVAPPITSAATLDVVFLSGKLLCGATQLDVVDSPERRQSATAVLEPRSS